MVVRAQERRGTLENPGQLFMPHFLHYNLHISVVVHLTGSDYELPILRWKYGTLKDLPMYSVQHIGLDGR